MVKGTQCESTEDNQAAVTRVLANSPFQAFQKCYEALKRAAQGNRFEGDGRVFGINLKYTVFTQSVSLLNSPHLASSDCHVFLSIAKDLEVLDDFCLY